MQCQCALSSIQEFPRGEDMVTAEVEVKLRQLSLVTGVLFGVGWRIFIDCTVTFNGAVAPRSVPIMGTWVWEGRGKIMKR